MSPKRSFQRALEVGGAGWLLFSVLFWTTSAAIAQSGAIAPLPNVSGDLAGSISGKVEVSELGALNYSVPLAVPPGIGGMEPKLNLSFSGTRGDGLLATGWAISGFSSISRCPATVATDGAIDPVDYDASDKFCLDGQRLMVISGTYGAAGSEYRGENESFLKVIANGQTGSGPQSFTVYTKEGRIVEYGGTTDSRCQFTGATSITAWMISSVSDRSQKKIEFTYNFNSQTEERLPTRIDYTVVSSLPAAQRSSVRFDYEDRTYPHTQFAVGAFASATKRISKISMWTGETAAWEYRFAYSTSDYAKADRLMSLTECGADGVCLPSTEFTWGSEPSASSPPLQAATYANLADMHPNAGYLGDEKSIVVGDWDGDGKMDIGRIAMYAVRLYRSTGSTFELYQDFADFGWDNQCSRGPIVSGDWNGDGRTDFARGCGWGVVRFYLNLPQGWTHWVDEAGLTRSNNNALNAGAYPYAVGDWNGDGRNDIARVNENTMDFFVSTATGLNFIGSLNNLSPQQGFNTETTAPLVVGDWNGDGLTDVARKKPSAWGYTLYAFVATGTGWTALPERILGGNPNSESTNPLFVGDWNGDGLTDVGTANIQGSRFIYFFESNGHGFAEPYSASFYTPYNPFPIFTGDWNSDGMTDVAYYTGSGIRIKTVRNRNAYDFHEFYDLGGANYSTSAYPSLVGDWTGDGVPEFTRFFQNGTSAVSLIGSQPLNLVSIRDGVGAQTNIEYRYLTDPVVYTKGSGATYPTIDSQPPAPVVSSIGVVNSLGSVTRTNYRYSGLRFVQNGRGVAGFESIDTIDVSRGITAKTRYRQDFPFTGLVQSVERRSAGGTLLSQRTERWIQQALTGGRYLVLSDQSIDEQFELNGDLVTRQVADKTYDEYGNLLTELITHADGFTQRSVHTYNNDTAHWLIGQIARTAVTATGVNDSPPITRTTAFQYSTSSTDFGSGLLLQETLEPDYPALRIQKNYTYDSVGNKIETRVSGQGVATQTETIGYDSSLRFPSTVTNALGQVATQEFDVRHGKQTRQVDPNGLVTLTTYDAFGRALTLVRPDGTMVRTLYLRAAAQNTLGASYILRTDTSGQPPIISHYDALGRELRKETVGFDGRSVYVDRVYNERGETTHISEPYFSNETPRWQISEYDLLSRVVRLIEPGNRVTTIEYFPLSTVITDPLENTTTTNTDARGRVIEVFDTEGSRLGYDYDSFGNAVTIVDQLDNVTTATFDIRGNRLELDEPNMGVSTYAYDAFGRQTSQTNAKGETQTFEYDLLNRVVRSLSPEGEVRWFYDTAANGIGQIGSVTGPNGYRFEYQYDQLGRVRTERHTALLTQYQFSHGYDQYSRPISLTYPNGFVVKNSYNAAGYLSMVRRADTNAIVWEGRNRNARGQVVQDIYGGIITNNQTYSADTGLIETARSTNSRQGILQNVAFQFNALGNLMRRSDLRVNRQEDFTYDSLSRLKSATVLGQPAVTVNYNAVGNIVSRSDVGTYTYNGVDGGPHAVTRIVGPKANQYDYDAAGNRVSDTLGTYDYRWDGKMSTALRGDRRFEFRYDPLGELYLQEKYLNNNLTERKVSITELFERTDSGNIRKETVYISGGDGIMALSISNCTLSGRSFCPLITPTSSKLALSDDYLRTPATEVIADIREIQSTKKAALLYLLKDHLGSISAIVDSNGTALEYLSYDAWGLKRDPISWNASERPASRYTDHGFTGHIQLDDLQLIHMKARVYDPNIGRFLSPDPVVQSPTNMQSLNRYSYVLNNPLSMVDPNGHFGKRFWKKLRSLLRMAIVAVVTIATGGYTLPAFGTLSLSINSALAIAMSGVATSIANGIASAIVYGYSIGDGLINGIRNSPTYALQAMLNYGIGSAFDAKSGGPLKDYAHFKIIAHGVSNGTMSAVGGGRFADGFAAGALGSLGGQVGDLPGAILGGATASALTGGKFGDGIIRASMVYLYNDLAHDLMDYLRHVNEVLSEQGAGAWEDLTKGSAFYGAMNDLPGVMANLPANHPWWATYMETVSLGLGFTKGAMMFAGMSTRSLVYFNRAVESSGLFSLALGVAQNGPSAFTCDAASFGADGAMNYRWAMQTTHTWQTRYVAQGLIQLGGVGCGVFQNLTDQNR